MKKALIRHILQSPTLLALLPSNCPPLKANSIRFRSLAFASTVFGRKADTTDANGEPIEPGGRGRKRARDWRESEGTDERGVRGGFRHKEAPAAPVVEKEKKGALTDGQKRRVAFIRGELNEGKKACNAYLVLDAFPASFTTLSIKDLLVALVSATDGSVFESFTLRADHVRPRSSAATTAAAQLANPSKASMNSSLIPPSSGPSYTVPPVEARRTLFMGGLDFAESEESVREATEKMLVLQRGECSAGNWVERVRIVRDASTGLGKGFGYVLMRVSMRLLSESIAEDLFLSEMRLRTDIRYLRMPNVSMNFLLCRMDNRSRSRNERCEWNVAKQESPPHEQKPQLPLKRSKQPQPPSLVFHFHHPTLLLPPILVLE